jgi:rod shape-determining protein MreD
MKWLFVFIIILLVLFQLSVASNFAIGSIVPNFLFSFLIALAFLKNFRQSIACAFLGGLLLDLIIGWPFGLILLAFILIVALVNFISSDFLETTNLAIVAGIGFSAVLAYFLLIEVLLKSANLLKLTDLYSDFFHNFFYISFPSAIYNTFLIVLFYLGIKRLEEKRKTFKI